MYCPHCGKEINDAATFCPHCGEAVRPSEKEEEKVVEKVEETVPEAPVEEVPTEELLEEEKTTKHRWKSIVAIVLAALLVVAIGGGIFFSIQSTYKAPINRLVGMVNSRSTDYNKAARILYSKCLPKELSEIGKEIVKINKDYDVADRVMDLDGEGSLEKYIKYIYENYDEEYGSDWKVSVDYMEVGDIDEVTLMKYANHLNRSIYPLETAINKEISIAKESENYQELFSDMGMSMTEMQDFLRDMEKLSPKLERFSEATMPDAGKSVKVTFTTTGPKKTESGTLDVNFLRYGNRWVPAVLADTYSSEKYSWAECTEDFFEDWDDLLEDVDDIIDQMNYMLF